MIDAKEYLKSFETEESLLQLKLRQLQGIQNRLKSVSAPMDKELVSHTPNVSMMSETVALLIDMQHEIDLLTTAIMQRKREAYHLLDLLQPDSATALMEFFLEGKSIAQVQKILHLSRRQTQRRLHDAIEEFQAVLNKNEAEHLYLEYTA